MCGRSREEASVAGKEVGGGGGRARSWRALQHGKDVVYLFVIFARSRDWEQRSDVICLTCNRIPLAAVLGLSIVGLVEAAGAVRGL